MNDDLPPVAHLSVPPLQPWPVGPTPARPPAIFRQSRGSAAVVFGFIVIVAAAALGRGWGGATTTAGRVTLAVGCGILLVGAVAMWALTVRNPLELQIWDDRIVLTPTTGGGVLDPLTRDGGLVGVIRRLSGRTPTWGVRQPATDRWLGLDLFDVRAVQAALAERGWLLPAQD